MKPMAYAVATLKVALDIILTVVVVFILVFQPASDRLVSYLFLAAVLAVTVFHWRDYARQKKIHDEEVRNAGGPKPRTPRQSMLVGLAQIVAGLAMGISELLRHHEAGECLFALIWVLLGLLNIATGASVRQTAKKTSLAPLAAQPSQAPLSSAAPVPAQTATNVQVGP